MRLRNVKNKEQILASSPYLITNPKDYCGTWSSVFCNHHPIYLEIGMGKGKFLIEQALRHPENNYIGIERYDSVLARAVEKVPEGLFNLRIVRANAIDVDTFFDHEISLLYLNFSDPWPKKRHALRRLTSPVFLAKYDSIFSDVPRIIQKTDNRSLFEYSLMSLVEYGYYFEDISLDLHHSDYQDNVMTEFEERFVGLGQVIYYLSAVKKNVNIS